MECMLYLPFLSIHHCFLYFCNPNDYSPYAQLERITIGDGKSLKVEILSDSQLTYFNGGDKEYVDHLERSFNERAGHQPIDFRWRHTDLGSSHAFRAKTQQAQSSSSLTTIQKAQCMYGSDKWGDKGITKVLKGYQQISASVAIHTSLSFLKEAFGKGSLQLFRHKTVVWQALD